MTQTVKLTLLCDVSVDSKSADDLWHELNASTKQ
jgi:hypothetical protein